MDQSRNITEIVLALSLLFGSVLTLGCGETADSTASVAIESDSESATKLDWPSIYGPNHNSISNESGLVTTWSEEGPPVLWRRPVGEGFGSVISVDSRVLLMGRYGDQETIECLDAETGQPIWDHSYSTSCQCTYEYSTGPYSTPVANDQFVFCVGAQGQLHCLDHASGEVIWQRDLFSEYEIEPRDWPFAGSPLLLEDRLILNLGAVEKNAGIIALSLSDGQTLWESTNQPYAHTTPTVATIHEQQLVFVLAFDGLVCLKPESGDVLWEVAHRVKDPRGMNNTNAVSPVVVGDRVCVVSGPKVKPGFRCFQILPDGSYEEPFDDIRLLKSQYTPLVPVGDYVFGLTPMTVGGPTLKCIDLNAGKISWKGKPNVGRANMLAVGDSILMLAEDGNLAAMKINFRKMEITSRTAKPILKKPCYTSMALANGKLFLRNEQELVCLDLSKE